MSLKISEPKTWESPRQWRMRNGLDNPEWDIYARIFAAWGFRVSFIAFVIGLIAGHLVK
jgi:hypothetical protein